jgi:hypothetical protein
MPSVPSLLRRLCAHESARAPPDHGDLIEPGGVILAVFRR